MAMLADLVEMLRTDLRVALAVGAGVVIAGYLLLRKPKIQRDADARLAALRRDKADRYKDQRPPR